MILVETKWWIIIFARPNKNSNTFLLKKNITAQFQTAMDLTIASIEVNLKQSENPKTICLAARLSYRKKRIILQLILMLLILMNKINLTLRIHKIDMAIQIKTKNRIIIVIELETTTILTKVEIFQKTTQLRKENQANYQNKAAKIKLKNHQIKWKNSKLSCNKWKKRTVKLLSIYVRLKTEETFYSKKLKSSKNKDKNYNDLQATLNRISLKT